jgi:uncharacterized membrane protein
MLNLIKNKIILNPIMYICLIGFCLGLFFISKQSLWLDEYTSIQVADQSLKKIITGKAFDNHTPPFYYILLHFWIKMGKTEFVLRSFSVIFGVLSIYLIYYLGKMLFNYKIALFSALLTAISPFQVYYSQEGRMYTLFMALSIAIVILFIKILNEGKLKNYLIYFIISIAGLYTHYYFAFLLVTINFAFFYKCFLNKTTIHLKQWIYLQILILIFLLPWLPVLLKITQTGGQHRKYLFSVIPYAFFRFNVGYAIFPLNMGVKENFSVSLLNHLWELLFIFSFFGMLFLQGLRKSMSGRYPDILPLWLFAPALLSMIISLKFQMLSERYLIALFPAYLLLISLAILSIKKRVIKSIITGICCFVFCLSLWQYYFSPNFGKEQWRDVAGYISENAEENDTILVDASFVAPVFCYYYGKCGPNVIGIKSINDLESRLSDKNIHIIWLIQSHSTMNEKILNNFTERFKLINKKIFPYETGISIYCYARNYSR